MEIKEIAGVNVAPSSTSGHYIQDAENVIDIDNVAETYFVEGKSKLVTKNHTTLEREESSLITTQVVYNPFSAMFQKAKD
jgi:hypothetical protein